MQAQWLRRGLLAAIGASLMAGAWLASALPAQDDYGQMTEFADRSPAAWINSKPLSRMDLRGKVVLLEVFASG